MDITGWRKLKYTRGDSTVNHLALALLNGVFVPAELIEGNDSRNPGTKWPNATHGFFTVRPKAGNSRGWVPVTTDLNGSPPAFT